LTFLAIFDILAIFRKTRIFPNNLLRTAHIIFFDNHPFSWIFPRICPISLLVL
jgi:hypothetical protein